MRVVQVFVSSVGLLLGLGAVALSLSLVSQVSSHESSRLTARELYWGEEILPDHLFYPGLMVMDRVQLERAEPTEKIYMQVVYAGRRLVYAQELIKKEEIGLAITTLTKSQKYLLQAAIAAQQAEHAENTELRTYVLKALVFHKRELVALEPYFENADTAPLDSLSDELQMNYEKLLAQYRAEQPVEQPIEQ